MHHRLSPLLALLLSYSVPLASAYATDVGDHHTYAMKTFGAAGRYSVSSIDYTWFDARRGRSVPARIYYPSRGAEPKGFPSSSSRPAWDARATTVRILAAIGPVAATCRSTCSTRGATKRSGKGTLRPRKELQRAFYAPENIRNRPMDIIFVIDQLEQMQRDGSTPGNRCDLTRIGVAGHDFGAQTVLALAGQVLPGRIAFAEPRVKAVVAMSSPVPLGQVPLERGLRRHRAALPAHHRHGRQQHRRHDHRRRSGGCRSTTPPAPINTWSPSTAPIT